MCEDKSLGCLSVEIDGPGRQIHKFKSFLDIPDLFEGWCQVPWGTNDILVSYFIKGRKRDTDPKLPHLCSYIIGDYAIKQMKFKNDVFHSTTSKAFIHINRDPYYVMVSEYYINGRMLWEEEFFDHPLVIKNKFENIIGVEI